MVYLFPQMKFAIVFLAAIASSQLSSGYVVRNSKFEYSL